MKDARARLIDLETLAATGDATKRPEALKALLDLFLATSEDQERSHMDTFGAAMEHVAFNLDAEERVDLAAQLAQVGKAPTALIRRLAQDEISVAHPVLEQSVCLTEKDLIELAGMLDKDHLCAMANRATLSSQITDILVERGNNEVLETVAGNSDAHFSERGFAKLSHAAGMDRSLFSVLNQRRDVPKDLVEDARASLSELKKRKMKEVARNRRPRSQVIKENMIADFARAGMLSEAITGLAFLTGYPEIYVKQCFVHGSDAALAHLCKADNVSTETYAALLRLRAEKYGLELKTVSDSIRNYRRLSRNDAQRALGYEEGEEEMVR